MLLDYACPRKDDLSSKIAPISGFLALGADNKDNMVEDIIRDKLNVQRASCAQLLSLILEREKLKKNNISALESEIQGFQGKLYVYTCRMYPIEIDNKRKGTLEKMISDLEKRVTQEEVDCWKDTVELWRDLLKLAIEYKAALRKSKILLLED